MVEALEITSTATLACATHRINNRSVFLTQVFPGYELAGSAAVWTDGYYRVHWLEKNSSTEHGCRFADYEQARDWFERITL